jgi:hypothetical protein
MNIELRKPVWGLEGGKAPSCGETIEINEVIR